MRAKELSALLKKGDWVAVSNITGREASQVTGESQKYCGNIIGGWALGKGGQQLETPAGSVPVYATLEDLVQHTPVEKRPRKIIVYSPPEAVYGEVKEIIQHGGDFVETIFIITEHVSVEVTAKIWQICQGHNIDVLGCNTLGMINVHDRVRIGAVGGDDPDEAFLPGSVTIISNSGNMVNTIASYLKASGMGTAYGISTGKDPLIMTATRELLELAGKDQRTKMVVLYVEPGGVYESKAVEMLSQTDFPKPLVVYVAGKIAEKYNVSLGHAGAVVEGRHTSASGKMQLFDDYFGIEPYNPEKFYKKTAETRACLQRGIRVTTLHDIPKAVGLVADILEIKHDLSDAKPLGLNPWFVSLGKLSRHLPTSLLLPQGAIPEPYASQFKEYAESKLGANIARMDMRNASHASSNDGVTPRVYGYSLSDFMRKKSFAALMILAWTGEMPCDAFEEKLVEMLLIACLTNGPGTISAQGAKLSASAGNAPNTAMIGTLASIGNVHGGNGAEAVDFLMQVFEPYDLINPYEPEVEVKIIAQAYAEEYKKKKFAAREASVEYGRIPCLGHPVFKDDPVNYDPREQVVSQFIKEQGRTNVFLDFYHCLVQALKDNGSLKKVLAVNIDAALACVWLAICWPQLRDKRMTKKRAREIPFVAFALGRVAGGAAEFLDHQDYGREMDMRVPVEECKELTKTRNINCN